MSEEVVIHIQDLSRGGAGLSRDEEGRVIFVPFTVPGDRVRVRMVRRHKRYFEAELMRIIEPSPVRQQPRCSVFMTCGGCDWQHVPYSLQWETKVRGLKEALRRIGVQPPEIFEGLPAEGAGIWSYRNRIQLHGWNDQVGFFKKGSRTLVPIERCDIAHPSVNALLPSIREEGRKRGTKPYKVELELLKEGKVAVSWNQGHGAHGFRQVHDQQNIKLQRWVAGKLDAGTVIWDLYGGNGNLTRPIAANFAEVHCVDVTAPGDALVEAETRYFYHCSSVADWISRQSDRRHLQVVIDPPREGMGSDANIIAEGVRRCGGRKALLIGCDVDSWSKDLRAWLKLGWKFTEFAALDLFPQTHHVEALAVLERVD